MELFANEMLEQSGVDGRLLTIEWTYSFIWNSVGMKLKKRRVGGRVGQCSVLGKKEAGIPGLSTGRNSQWLCTRGAPRPSKAGHRTPATNASGNPPSKMVPCTDLLLFRVQVRYILGF